jgi:hypothetical protein
MTGARTCSPGTTPTITDRSRPAADLLGNQGRAPHDPGRQRLRSRTYSRVCHELTAPEQQPNEQDYRVQARITMAAGFRRQPESLASLLA